MTFPLLQTGLPFPTAVPPSWVRPPAEKTAPIEETQKERERPGQQNRQPETFRSLLSAETDGSLRAATAVSGERPDAGDAANDDEADTGRDAPAGDGNRRGEDRGDGVNDLTAEEEKVVAELKARDAEVRAHERAHQAVGGDLAGAATYETQRGPDGREYAIGGEVSINVAPESDPADTIVKMERVKAAALAPAEPSGQDRAVASQADAQRAEAQAELARQQREQAAAAYGRAGAYGQVQDARDRLDLVA